MAFSIGSPFSPALPSPYRSTFIGVFPVIVMPLTREAIDTPDATVVSPPDVDAVPPSVRTLQSENVNSPLGVGYDAAARPVEVSSVCPSHVSFSVAIVLSLQSNSHWLTFTPVYVNGCTVGPLICGRPTCSVMKNPALEPFVWFCLYAVPRTTVGVTTAEPRACFHQNPIESATVFAADPIVCSIVISPLTSDRDCTVRALRLYACPAFRPIPSSQPGLNTNFSDRNS